MELEQYFRIIVKRWWLILLLTLIGGASALYFTSQQPARYRSTATLLLSPALTREALLADPATVTNRLAQTYARYLKTNTFAQIVIEEEELTLTPRELVGSVEARSVADTQFFEISATRNSPEEARALAAAVSNYFIREILNQQRDQEQLRLAATSLNESQQALLDRLETERVHYEQQVAALREQVTTLEESSPSETRDGQLIALRAQLNEQESKLLQVMSDMVTLRPIAESGALINTVTLIEQAQQPTAPISNNALANILFALSASAVIGLALAFGLEYLDFTVKRPEDLELLYGEPPLGVLIKVKGIEGTKSPDTLTVLGQGRSSSAEAFRALRTNIQFSSADRSLRSLVITSAAPGEGKTTVASNLAVVIAQAGKRVILVDADLRRPTIHKQFNLPNTKGFTNLIIAEEPLDEFLLDPYLQAGPVEGLSILTSGFIPPNPAELLSLERTQQVQALLAAAADLVIYDSPPIATVTDAAILASRADGTLQVVQAGRTRRDLILKARQILQRVGANVVGSVLNKVEQKDIGYYYYYYQDNHYTDTGQAPKPGNPDGRSRLPKPSPEATVPVPVAASPPGSSE